jgi:tetratricopeptide (TPR) repeat protein
MKYIIIFLILFTPLLAEHNQIVLDGEDTEILTFIHNAELEEAENLIDQKINVDPVNPKYYLMKTSMYFHSRYFRSPSMDRDSLANLLAEWSHKTIEVAENQEKTTLNKFYLGSAYCYRSVSDILKRSYWDAYFSARKGRDYLEDVVKENPELYDAYVHLGVREYFVDTRITGWRSSLAWILGQSGDKDKGLQFIEKTAQNGKLNKDEAKFISIAIYRFFEPDLQKALAYAKDYKSRYPDNPYAENQFLALEFQNLFETHGVKFVAENIDSLRIRYRIDDDGTLNNLGYNYINQENYDVAIAIFKLNTELFPEVANCWDSLAEGYMLSGDNQNAIRYYRKAYRLIFDDQSITEEQRQSILENIKAKMDQLGAELEPGSI